MFINVDNIAIFLCFMFLVLFPRMLVSSDRMAALFNAVVLYKAYTSYRSDGVLDGLFQRLALGPVEVEVNQETLAAFSMVSAASEKCAVLFLAMLMGLRVNTLPTTDEGGVGGVDKKDEKGAKIAERDGRGEVPKTVKASVGSGFTILALFVVVYLVFRAEEGTWFEVSGKLFEGERYQVF